MDDAVDTYRFFILHREPLPEKRAWQRNSAHHPGGAAIAGPPGATPPPSGPRAAMAACGLLAGPLGPAQVVAGPARTSFRPVVALRTEHGPGPAAAHCRTWRTDFMHSGEV